MVEEVVAGAEAGQAGPEETTPTEEEGVVAGTDSAEDKTHTGEIRSKPRRTMAKTITRRRRVYLHQRSKMKVALTILTLEITVVTYIAFHLVESLAGAVQTQPGATT